MWDRLEGCGFGGYYWEERKAMMVVGGGGVWIIRDGGPGGVSSFRSRWLLRGGEGWSESGEGEGMEMHVGCRELRLECTDSNGTYCRVRMWGGKLHWE